MLWHHVYWISWYQKRSRVNLYFIVTTIDYWLSLLQPFAPPKWEKNHCATDRVPINPLGFQHPLHLFMYILCIFHPKHVDLYDLHSTWLYLYHVKSCFRAGMHRACIQACMHSCMHECGMRLFGYSAMPLWRGQFSHYDPQKATHRSPVRLRYGCLPTERVAW